jgi:hypothetical protein
MLVICKCGCVFWKVLKINPTDITGISMYYMICENCSWIFKYRYDLCDSKIKIENIV